MSGLIDRCDEKAPEYRDISRFFWHKDRSKMA